MLWGTCAKRAFLAFCLFEDYNTIRIQNASMFLAGNRVFLQFITFSRIVRGCGGDLARRNCVKSGARPRMPVTEP